MTDEERAADDERLPYTLCCQCNKRPFRATPQQTRGRVQSGATGRAEPRCKFPFYSPGRSFIYQLGKPRQSIVGVPIHRRDRRPHRAHPTQLHPHQYAHERADLLEHLVHAAERRQRDALVRRAAVEEGVVEGAVLGERVGRPGLEVGAELARVTVC